MPLPGYLSTATLTFGPYYDLAGNPAFVGMTGILSLNTPMVDSIGGGTINPSITVTIGSDGTASAGPVVASNDPAVTQGTVYVMRFQALSYKPTPGDKTFQILRSQGTTIDYDTILPITGSPGTVSLPTVVSVNGKTGVVALGASDVGADAAGAAAAVLPTQTSNAGKYLTTNGTAASWGTVSSGGSLTVASTVTTAGALTVAKHTPVDATSGPLTMTLPTGATGGTLIAAEKVDSSTNAVTVTGNIRGVGGTNETLVGQYEAMTFIADTAGSWWVDSGHKTKTWLSGNYSPLAPQFHGATYKAYGHSFGVVVGSGITANSTAGGLYPARLRDLLHADTTLYTNRCVSNDQMQDIAQRALGSAATWTVGTFGLVTLLGNQNDVGREHGNTQGITSYQNTLRAFLSLMRAGSRIEQAAGTYAGVWAGGASGASWNQASVSTATSGGSFAFTNNPGDTWTGTFTGTDATLMLCGFGDSTGAAFTVTVDGSQVASANLSLQNKLTANALTTGFGPYPVQIRGLSSGSHTVVATHTGTSGKTMAVDCLLPWSATPPTVLVMKDTTCTTAGYARYTSPPTDTDVAAFNGYIDTIVAEFPSDASIAVANPIADGWNPATMTYSDGQHPSERGHAFLTASALKALTSLGYRRGQNFGV